MIIGLGDINLTKNALSAAKAQGTADEALDKANEAIKLHNSAWYLQSVALTSANGQNTNFYGAATPENPKEGDLWFVYNEDGNVINMLRYKNVQWVAEVDLSNAQSMLNQAEEIAKRMESNTSKFDSLFTNVTDLWANTDEQNGKMANIKASVDGLQTTVTDLSDSTSSQITQLSNQLDLKVSKGSVISQINLEAESATIKSKAIVLAGDTTVLGTFTVPAAQITGKLSANQIAVSQLSALTADLGNVTAGRLTGVEIDVSTDVRVGNSLYVGTYLDRVSRKYIYFNDNVSISSYNDGYENSFNIAVHNSSNDAEFELSSTKCSLSVKGTMNLLVDDVKVYSKLHVNDIIYQQNLPVATEYWVSSSYWRKDSDTGWLSSNVWIGNASIGVGGTFDGSTNPSNVSLGQSNIYVPNKVYAGGVALTSDRDRKKNIVEFTKSVWEDIKTLKPYQYNLDNELDTELPHLGVILQESPVEIVDPIGAVENYAYATFILKGLKEAVERIEILEDQLKLA